MPSPECQNFLALLKEKFLRGEFLGLKVSKPKSSELLEINFAQYTRESRISGVYKYKTKTITKHYDIDTLLAHLGETLGVELLSATVFSESDDVSLDHNRRGEPSIVRRRPSKIRKDIQHNRVREYLIPETAPFLRELKISGAEGIRPAMAHKFRQINKFVEIFDSTLKAAGLGNQKRIRVCDLGAGKSYLTFAIDFHLRETLKLEAEVIAIERREDLVNECKRVAKEVGSSITFKAGNISEAAETYDIFVALHACDTATDDAIVAAAKSQAKAILLAPCCQKWLRSNQHIVKDCSTFLRDGIIAERHLAMLTDLIRAAALEKLGYAAKVFEFIGSEDTDKNIMISGTLTGRAGTSTRGEELGKFVDIKGYYLFEALCGAGYDI